jgi:UDP-glucose 4-epimerase
VIVQGSGQQRRPFVHVAALTGALHRLMDAALPSGTYDAVEESLSVLEIVAALRGLYPELELLFVNQHIDLASLDVCRDERLAAVLPPRAATLEGDLRAFRAQFAF